MRNISILALILVFLLSSAMSCEKDEVLESENDTTLIFGLVYGFCQGDCAQLFKLEGDNLYEDDGIDRLQAEQVLLFKETPLSNVKYDLATSLRSDFPASLINNPDTIIGIPNAYDQGGIYIEYQNGEVDRFWMLDTNLDALPEDLRPYADRLKEVWTELTQ
ncbi:MAG: hypothetical protein AAF806_18925 [Bacteroidota bacterium]